MITYTITENEGVIGDQRTFCTTIITTSSAQVAAPCAEFRTTDSVFITNITSSNGNITNRTSRSVRAVNIQRCENPTGGGIGCINGVYITEAFYLIDGRATIIEQGVSGPDESNCSQTRTTKLYNIPRETDRQIITTTTTQSNVVLSTSATINYIPVKPVGTIINNKLTVQYETAEITVASQTVTSRTVKTTTFSTVKYTDGYINATDEFDFSPAFYFRNSVYTRVELDLNDGLWYPTVSNFDGFITNSNIELKNLMTFKEFPATIDLKPVYSFSNVPVGQASCNSISCNDALPQLTTSTSRKTISQTYTRSQYTIVTLTIDGYDASGVGINSFPIPTRAEGINVRSTATDMLTSEVYSYTNVNTYLEYSPRRSTFKVNLASKTWGEAFTKLHTTEKQIGSIYTYTRSTGGQYSGGSTTVKKTSSELFGIKISPQPTRKSYSELKIAYINGQAIPSVTNNFYNQIVAGNLTLEKINYVSYAPNVRVIFPKKYTYASSTASILGDGIKLSINKQTSTQTTFYPFSPKGGRNLTQRILIDYYAFGYNNNVCNGGFMIGGFSPDGNATNSIQKLFLDGLHAEIEPFVSRSKYETTSNQIKAPLQNSTANYPINYNRFYINRTFRPMPYNNLDVISTHRLTNLNDDFIRGIYCMRNKTTVALYNWYYYWWYFYYGNNNYIFYNSYYNWGANIVV